jgi:hypothetical protein
MGNKVTDAIASNFRRADTRVLAEPQISRAEAAGLRPPPLSAEQKSGLSATANLARQRFDALTKSHERYEKERADYERSRDDAIWAKVLARRGAL